MSLMPASFQTRRSLATTIQRPAAAAALIEGAELLRGECGSTQRTSPHNDVIRWVVAF